eukprot:GHVH01016417.1.p1 GENE.GHVH01016417.1~~GHVH01016417.1.p1  ORF type:complete len:147 (+),score=20.05 GHVH01016417.1:242-682(+)
MVMVFVKAGLVTHQVETSSSTTTQEVAHQCGLSSEATFVNGLTVLNSFEGLGEESLVIAFEPLVGGGKKRKKKKPTTPKKIPHIKKKVKLHVLKCYRVDGHDRVVRLRKQCPSAMCGPGVFMATHEDRTYCGRCYMTFVASKEQGE